MKVSRRTLLSGAVAAAAIGTRIRAQAPVDPTKVRSRPPRPVGERAASVTIRRHGRAGNQQGHPEDLSASSRRRTCTSNDTMAASRDRSARYSLLIHGMVERPMVFTLADLKRFPSVSRIHFSSAPATSGARPVRRPSRGSSPD